MFLNVMHPRCCKGRCSDGSKCTMHVWWAYYAYIHHLQLVLSVMKWSATSPHHCTLIPLGLFLNEHLSTRLTGAFVFHVVGDILTGKQTQVFWVVSDRQWVLKKKVVQSSVVTVPFFPSLFSCCDLYWEKKWNKGNSLIKIKKERKQDVEN